MVKDTNPDNYKVDDADFIAYMDDPKIGRFGDWMYANGYNVRDAEIVRCRGCKHRKQKDAGYVCTAFFGFEPWVGDEFFCGNGEAKK